MSFWKKFVDTVKSYLQEFVGFLLLRQKKKQATPRRPL